jgi:nitroreductase
MTSLTKNESVEAEDRPLLDTLTAIRTRRAIKEYLQTEIPQDWIKELLDAAHWAPNHHLTHPWRYHVFMGEGREALVQPRYEASVYAFQQKGEPVPDNAMEFARAKCFSAPVMIIVSMIVDKDPIMDRENYAACWCSIENLLLAGTARGLGTYPSTGDWVNLNFLGPVLGLGEDERPVSCIFVGYSEQPTMAKRLPVEKHTKWYLEAGTSGSGRGANNALTLEKPTPPPA